MCKCCSLHFTWSDCVERIMPIVPLNGQNQSTALWPVGGGNDSPSGSDQADCSVVTTVGLIWSFLKMATISTSVETPEISSSSSQVWGMWLCNCDQSLHHSVIWSQRCHLLLWSWDSAFWTSCQSDVATMAVRCGNKKTAMGWTPVFLGQGQSQGRRSLQSVLSSEQWLFFYPWWVNLFFWLSVWWGHGS